jgi:hypothetical protein
VARNLDRNLDDSKKNIVERWNRRIETWYHDTTTIPRKKLEKLNGRPIRERWI